MPENERRTVMLVPDQVDVVDEMAHAYTGGDRDALVQLAVHRLLHTYLEERGARKEAESPLWKGSPPPPMGDEEPDVIPGQPMVVTMRELQRLREIFGRYPDGPIEIREEESG